MCKLFTITGITSRQASKNAWRLLYAASEALTRSDDDGFGYAAYSQTYGLIGERWLDPKLIWAIRGDTQRGKPDAAEIEGYSRIGTWPPSLYMPRVTCITAHARKSTNNVCLANVHPFYRKEPNGEFALAHNGVVQTGDLDLTGSKSCDSMGILNAYVNLGVPYLPEQITEMAKVVKGWYACTVLGVIPEGPYVEFFRYNAPLTVTEIGGVGYVWCTNEYIPIAAAKTLKLPVRQTWKVKEQLLFRVNAITGEEMGHAPFCGRSYQTTVTNYSNYGGAAGGSGSSGRDARHGSYGGDHSEWFDRHVLHQDDKDWRGKHGYSAQRSGQNDRDAQGELPSTTVRAQLAASLTAPETGDGERPGDKDNTTVSKEIIHVAGQGLINGVAQTYIDGYRGLDSIIVDGNGNVTSTTQED